MRAARLSCTGAGIGRTGTMLATSWTSMSAEEAIAAVRKARPAT